MSNGRCRMHGGKSPGAPTGERNGAYRTGQHTLEAVAWRRHFRAMLKAARETAEIIDT